MGEVVRFQSAVTTCLNKYATFDGRSCRAEYWWFALFQALGYAVFLIIDTQILNATTPTLAAIFTVLLILPTLAVSVRRLHDINRSGWWYLVILIPLIGGIVLLIWACTRGTQGPNKFGADPISFITPSIP